MIRIRNITFDMRFQINTPILIEPNGNYNFDFYGASIHFRIDLLMQPKK